MKAVKIILKRVGLPPEVREIDPTLEVMQALVGGYYELISLTPTVDLWCNEEGRALGLPRNLAIAATQWPGLPEGKFDFVIDGRPEPDELPFPGEGYWEIFGDFFLASSDGQGVMTSLTDADREEWLKLLFPERVG